ncbi:hypothetical protein H5410_051949 [Solanum commersonii]|uniref:GRF-type domain-containing protein n=1 Tax=Solanum commersonii TaxID=4109 RepID=A0A9J5WZZ5_SOLCO|nr:hypothetical protein H5410_051949 [Solanum commersonii]
MSESSCDSISNSMIMTCFCGELARCFTSRTRLNPGRRFYRCSKPKSKLEVATLKMENLRESLNAVKIERVVKCGLGKPFNMDGNIAKLDFFENLRTAHILISGMPLGFDQISLLNHHHLITAVNKFTSE